MVVSWILGGKGLEEKGEGCGALGTSRDNLAGILKELCLFAKAAHALLALAAHSRHSLDQVACLPLQLMQE